MCVSIKVTFMRTRLFSCYLKKGKRCFFFSCVEASYERPSLSGSTAGLKFNQLEIYKNIAASFPVFHLDF